MKRNCRGRGGKDSPCLTLPSRSRGCGNLEGGAGHLGTPPSQMRCLAQWRFLFCSEKAVRSQTHTTSHKELYFISKSVTFTIPTPFPSSKEWSVIEGMPSVPFAFHALCRRNYFSYQFVDAKKSWVVQKTQIQVKLPCLTPFRLLSHTPRSRPESLSDQNHYLKAGTLCCCSSVLNLLCIWSNSPFFFSSWLCITDRLGGKQRPGQQEEGTR